MTVTVALISVATAVGNWAGVRDLSIRALRDASKWNGRGYCGNGEHTDAYRELVEENVFVDECLYYRPSSPDNLLTPAERSTHLALSWAMCPSPVRFGDAKCVVGKTPIVVSRFLNVEFPGYWLVAENSEAAIWKSAELESDEKVALCGSRSSVRPWRELLGVLVVCLLIAGFVRWVLPKEWRERWCQGTVGASIWSIAFFVFAVALALSHTFVAPTGLGVYGGKAKLYYLLGGIPSGFFTDSAYSSFQPAYPPGLAFLTLVAYWVAGGCGEWMTQIIPVFATALTLGIMLKVEPCSGWMVFLTFAAFFGEQVLQIATFYYAEPFVALLGLLGWMRIRMNQRGLLGWVILGGLGCSRRRD